MDFSCFLAPQGWMTRFCTILSPSWPLWEPRLRDHRSARTRLKARAHPRAMLRVRDHTARALLAARDLTGTWLKAMDNTARTRLKVWGLIASARM